MSRSTEMTDDVKDAAQSPVEADAHAAPPPPEGHSVRDAFPPLRLQGGLEPRADGRYYVAELLAYHDRAFVESAYAAALGRAPDAEELAATLADLRAARRGKREIIEDLVRSDEGARIGAGVRVRGVATPGWKQRARRLPLVGYLWQLLGAIARLPTALRHQQEFETYALAQQQHIADHFNAQQRAQVASDDDLRLALDDLQLALTDANEAISMLSDALASLAAQQAEARVEFDQRQDEQTHRIDEQARQLDARLAARLDRQEEYLIHEQRAIVEAQKAALVESEARLGESLEAQARALEELARQLREVRAAVEATRGASIAEKL
ncbi:MAG: hypothetical protein QOF61_608 [Acidobacteriota bacterium]|nr:hypothetical protein [Acidobacteriota bacterium]